MYTYIITLFLSFVIDLRVPLPRKLNVQRSRSQAPVEFKRVQLWSTRTFADTPYTVTLLVHRRDPRLCASLTLTLTVTVNLTPVSYTHLTLPTKA